MQFNKVLYFIVFLYCISCSQEKKTDIKTHTTSGFQVNDSLLTLIRNKGLVLYKNKPFTGIGIRNYSNKIKAIETTYLSGKQNGNLKKWFPNGILSYSTNYTNGRINGVTKSWWKNGNLRSKSNHVLGVVTGKQQQWYFSGAIFKEMNYTNGLELGMQKAWRENGKIYNNYEAKNGRVFGLKRANLCFELEDEIVQYNEDN